MRKRNKRATRVYINGSRIALRDVAEIYITCHSLPYVLDITEVYVVQN